MRRSSIGKSGAATKSTLAPFVVSQVSIVGVASRGELKGRVQRNRTSPPSRERKQSVLGIGESSHLGAGGLRSGERLGI